MSESPEVYAALLAQNRVIYLQMAKAAMDQASRVDEASRRDRLTGLYNRSGIMDALKTQIAQNPGGVALIFGDVNGLKEVNDSQGHAKGDELLRKTGEVLYRSLRSDRQGDSPDQLGRLAARLAGDEFVAVLPGVSSEEEIDTVSSRITRNLAAEGIGMSVAGVPHRPGQTATELLAEADTAMYAEKQRQKREELLRWRTETWNSLDEPSREALTDAYRLITATQVSPAEFGKLFADGQPE